MTEQKTIMLIDDDPAIVSILQLKFEKTGQYRVLSTMDPLKAVGLAKESKPDIILCDIDMPEMGGGEVKAALRDEERTRNIPVVFLSSLIQKQDIQLSEDLIGGQHTVPKSIQFDLLLKLVERFTQ